MGSDSRLRPNLIIKRIFFCKAQTRPAKPRGPRLAQPYLGPSNGPNCGPTKKKKRELMPIKIFCLDSSPFKPYNMAQPKKKKMRQYQNSPHTHTHTQTQIHRRTKSNQTLNKFKYITKTNYSPNMVAALSQLQQNHQETKLHL